MGKLITPKEASKIASVSTHTLRNWANSGKIKHTRLETNGDRRYYLEEILKISGQETSTIKKIVYYARSSDGNKNSITNQINTIKEYNNNQEADYIIKDTGSGLNENRRGLQRLLTLSDKNEITDVYITHKDRLTRFGYSYLERYLIKNNVKIHVIKDNKYKTPQEELIQDFMSLIASFSGKFYKIRSKENQELLLKNAQKELNNIKKEG